jgi:hypothetical protein
LSLASKALYLLEEALGLRVALDLLDKALLVTLLKSSDAAEQQRGNRYKFLGLRILDQSTELAGGGRIKHHFKPPLAGIFPQLENALEVDKLSGFTVRNDGSAHFVDQRQKLSSAAASNVLSGASFASPSLRTLSNSVNEPSPSGNA